MLAAHVTGIALGKGQGGFRLGSGGAGRVYVTVHRVCHLARRDAHPQHTKGHGASLRCVRLARRQLLFQQTAAADGEKRSAALKLVTKRQKTVKGLGGQGARVRVREEQNETSRES